jgi:mannitol/fructose-specific phosphotransferase system IIA component
MGKPLIVPEGIHLGATANSKEEAVALCGEILTRLGAVEPNYVTAMQEREKMFSSFMGNGIAIPHGTDESRSFVNFGQLVFLQFAQTVPWDKDEVHICIGIAAKEDEHGEILGNLAELLLDEKHLETMKLSANKDLILSLLLRRSEESLR